MSRIATVFGTRPELVKLAPVFAALDAVPGLVQQRIHTGQHYSAEMDAVFFAELGLRAPDVTLHAGRAGATQAQQTAAILTGVESALLSAGARTDAVIVLGDTNSALGGALAAAKLAVPVVHIEAGCRSGDRAMPEEINRILIDHCATHLLAPDALAAENLRREGRPEGAIAVVGSTSLDAARRYAGAARGRPIVAEVLSALALSDPRELVLCTVHRAENTTPEVLPGLLAGLGRIAARRPICLPLHPRTRACIDRLGLAIPPRIHVLPPLGYLDMLALLCSARALCTDSGGLQEEAAVLGTPVLVLRPSTEWRYLVDAGCAVLVGNREPALGDRALAQLDDAPCAAMRAAARACFQDAGPSAAARIAGELTRRLG